MTFFSISVLPFVHYLLLLALDCLLRQPENVYFLWMHLIQNSCKSHLKKLGLLVSSSFSHLLQTPVFCLVPVSPHPLSPSNPFTVLAWLFPLQWSQRAPSSVLCGCHPQYQWQWKNSHLCPCTSEQIRASEKWCYQKRWPEHHNTVKEHAEPSAGIVRYRRLCRTGKDGLLIPPLFQRTGILQLFKKVLRNALVMFLQLI